MSSAAKACCHPPVDAADELYCVKCGAFVVEGLERCGAIDGDHLCVEPKGHGGQHRGVDTTNRRDIELLILSREW